MFYDIIIIGGGASGLMAAYGAASSMDKPSVLVLEKMPRPGRKIMITGKGRCNFTNLKDWEDFSRHVRTNPNFLKPAFFNLTPQRLIDLLDSSAGLESVVERGDRAFPVSHRASDVVDALARLAQSAGAVIRTAGEVTKVSLEPSPAGQSPRMAGTVPEAASSLPAGAVSEGSAMPAGQSSSPAGSFESGAVNVSENGASKAVNVSVLKGGDRSKAGDESGRNDAGEAMPEGFVIKCSDGASFGCSKLIIATGGLSYPGTGSTGDGYSWARSLGHSIKQCFPSLTALVPKGYKMSDAKDELQRIADKYKSLKSTQMAGEFGHMPESGRQTDGNGWTNGNVRTNGNGWTNGDGNRQMAGSPEGGNAISPAEMAGLKGHIDRSVPLSEIGRSLCGIELKNVGVKLFAGDNIVRDETGDISFTDGGLEGPVGFAISRDCVKAILSGAKTRVSIDMKPAIDAGRVKERVSGLWQEIQKDPRSRSLSTGAMMRILLGKLMPTELINGFLKWNPAVLRSARNGQRADLNALAAALKDWRFEIDGYVGYERCVVTAGGVATEEVLPKTMESRLVKGLYLCGEVLDIDSDTGGYNLHTAFATGLLAGQSAAKKLRE